jgi:hypothetical protein
MLHRLGVSDGEVCAMVVVPGQTIMSSDQQKKDEDF